jgi:DNA-binding IclR family transcriptional regulator
MATNPHALPGTQALSKGISILRAISSEHPAPRFARLRQKTSLPKATLSRILKTLAAEGLVRFESRDSSYHLGLSFLRLAFQVLEELDIRDIAHAELLKLRDQTSEAVHLGILDGLEVVYIDMVESKQAVGPIGRLGSSSSLHGAASGKVIVAYLKPGELAEMLPQMKLTRFTVNTITSQKRFKSHLEEIRRQGYAVNEEEEVTGVNGVAAPIFGHSREVVASIGITIPSYRYDPSNIKFYSSSVIETARIVSGRLGNSERWES